ncbi:hypothetical protein HMPREF1544_09831 [Mucor circinelloides 1006PhL]|uniref:Uncharacterized protein n=1 Tax=Mucor circinelloides f. circinelloides (strain 1006PhL) TaxID=1220926 RepID=S2J052_MUCC1|nr:hypothetical protein HMPREF1544_09831 [Mucor circinelloides 1006PhL]
MILTTHLWAICSDEENVKDDTNDTDDNFTVSMWQLWVDLIKEMNDAEEIHCHRYDLNFLPGETRVKAVNDKLKLLHNDTSQCYSADVILPLQSTSLEIV